MNSQELLTCREAEFKKWINASKGYGLAFARNCWNAAWDKAMDTRTSSAGDGVVNEEAFSIAVGLKGFAGGIKQPGGFKWTREFTKAYEQSKAAMGTSDLSGSAPCGQPLPIDKASSEAPTKSAPAREV